jgi:hypothetical protein
MSRAAVKRASRIPVATSTVILDPRRELAPTNEIVNNRARGEFLPRPLSPGSSRRGNVPGLHHQQSGVVLEGEHPSLPPECLVEAARAETGMSHLELSLALPQEQVDLGGSTSARIQEGGTQGRRRSPGPGRSGGEEVVERHWVAPILR